MTTLCQRKYVTHFRSSILRALLLAAVLAGCACSKKQDTAVAEAEKEAEKQRAVAIANAVDTANSGAYTITSNSKISVEFSAPKSPIGAEFRTIGGAIQVAASAGQTTVRQGGFTVDLSPALLDENGLAKKLRSIEGFQSDGNPEVRVQINRVNLISGSSHTLVCEISGAGIGMIVDVPATVLLINRELRIVGDFTVAPSDAVPRAAAPKSGRASAPVKEFAIHFDIRAAREMPLVTEAKLPSSEDVGLPSPSSTNKGVDFEQVGTVNRGSSESRKQIIQEFDANKDGQLSVEERKALRANIKERFDRDGNGIIDVGESSGKTQLSPAGKLAGTSGPPAGSEAKPMVEPDRRPEASQTAPQESASNFLGTTKVQNAPGASSHIATERMFQAFDHDHDGKLTRSELGDTRWQKFATADSNEDGEINAEELAALRKKTTLLSDPRAD